jgi:hypothetical protein
MLLVKAMLTFYRRFPGIWRWRARSLRFQPVFGALFDVFTGI